MSAIVIDGVDRPGLIGALIPHGLLAASLSAAPAVAALVASGLIPPLRPALVEAPDLAAAVALLAHGVDDVVLASDPDALVAARLAALVRRAPARLTVGDLVIDLIDRRVTRAGRRLALRSREYALLVRLARAEGAPVSRATLTRDVLGLAFDPGTNVVAAHLSRLRTALHAGGAPPMLVTERGQGYRLIAGAGAAG